MKSVKMLLGIALAVLTVGCCPITIGATSPQRVNVEEMFATLQRTFPTLRNGKELFVTTGEYYVFPLESYMGVVSSLANLPPCRFKAATVVVGKLHEQLNSLVAAGIAMGTNQAPAWFVVVMDTSKVLWGIDPTTKSIWQLQSSQVALLII